MRSALVQAAVAIAVPAGVVAAPPDKAPDSVARVLVDRLLVNLNSLDSAAVWEEFSTESKREFRKAYGAYVLSSPVEEHAALYQSLGFYESASTVDALSDEVFWERIVVDRAVCDADAREAAHDPLVPEGELPNWELIVDDYAMVSADIIGSKLVTVIEVPYYLHKFLMVSLHTPSSFQRTARVAPGIEPGMEEITYHYVFTGRLEADGWHLDIPLETIRLLRIRAAMVEG